MLEAAEPRPLRFARLRVGPGGVGPYISDAATGHGFVEAVAAHALVAVRVGEDFPHGRAGAVIERDGEIVGELTAVEGPGLALGCKTSSAWRNTTLRGDLVGPPRKPCLTRRPAG